MLEETSTIVLGERLEGYVREDTSTLVLGEKVEGYVRGHQHHSVRREARGLC